MKYFLLAFAVVLIVVLLVYGCSRADDAAGVLAAFSLRA